MRSLTSSRSTVFFRLLAIACAAVLVTATPSDAAKKKSVKKEASQKRQKKKGGGGGGYSPPYAALVVDAKTGKVLHSDNADAIRHPASLTKVMTLYVLFDELDRGTLTLQTPLKVSAEASRQAPSKLGLKPGETIKVEDAIKALVTKSANDVAVTVAENVSGSQSAFADRMTRKARALGMTSTVYKNASGLPDERQVTTARDLALLGRAIQDNHPDYYRYFSTRSFAWRGQVYSNHNKLLGNVKGVDGIKTGFVRASGFNLLTSANQNGRQVVAVVLGGKSSSSRDARMRELVQSNIMLASAGKRTAPMIAEAPMGAEPAPVLALATERASSPQPAPMALVPQPMPRPEVQQAPINLPEPVMAAVAAPVPAVSPGPVPAPVPEPVQQALQPSTGSSTMTPDAIAQRIEVANRLATTTPAAQDGMRWVVGAQPKVAAAAYSGTTPGSPAAPAVAAIRVKPAPAQVEPTPIQIAVQQPVQAGMIAHPAQPAPQPQRAAAPVQTAYAAPEPSRQEPAVAVSPPRPGWQIQIGATPDAAQAENLLIRASTHVSAVDKSVEPFTETVEKDGVTLYRARFAGFNERSAAAACKAVKRASLSCFTLKN